MEFSLLEDIVFDIGIKSIVNHLGLSNLTFHIEQNLSTILDFCDESCLFVEPLFLGNKGRLISQVYGIRFADAFGRTIGCTVERLLDGSELRELIEQGAFLSPREKVGLRFAGVERLEPLVSSQSNRIALSGCTNVRRDYHGQCLTVLLQYFARLISFTTYHVEYSASLARNGLSEAKLGSHVRIEPVCSNRSDGTAGDSPLFLSWTDRASMVQRVLDLPRHGLASVRLVATGQQASLGTLEIAHQTSARPCR